MAIYFQGFVCDEDSQHLRGSIRHHSVVSLSEVGITVGRGSPDEAVLRHAREAGRILITANESDFAVEMKHAANRCTPSKCYEGGGMITVPNGLPSFAFTTISRTMRLADTAIGWDEVFFLNLHVQVQRDGRFSVRRLPICRYLLKDHVDCETCAELGVLPL
jgi:hypothetical protein